jgi:hypothetical protein
MKFTMLRKIKYSKLAIVIFLTVLIWVWADLAQDEELSIPNSTIIISKTAPKLWVSFDEGPRASINNITLKGPASKIAEAKRGLDDNSLTFVFTLDVEQRGMTAPGPHSLPVLTFLRESHLIKQLGLTVESCDPATLTVNVVELLEKPLTIQCIDDSGISLTSESIEPSRVDMFVPGDWGRDRLTAYIKLTEADVIRARSAAIVKTPYIELPDGQIREAAVTVNVKMPPETDPLNIYTVTTGTLGYCFSPNLQGRYKVDVDNLTEIISSIAIKATFEAKQAYESMRYQVILEIADEDVKLEEPRRTVVYNFPERYVRKDEIKLNQPPVTAQFRLTRLPSAENP